MNTDSEHWLRLHALGDLRVSNNGSFVRFESLETKLLEDSVESRIDPKRHEFRQGKGRAERPPSIVREGHPERKPHGFRYRAAAKTLSLPIWRMAGTSRMATPLAGVSTAWISVRIICGNVTRPRRSAEARVDGIRRMSA